jgi:hypothetical protein
MTRIVANPTADHRGAEGKEANYRMEMAHGSDIVPYTLFSSSGRVRESNPGRQMKALSQENNFFYLCFALIGVLLSSALVRQFAGTWGENLFAMLIVAMMLLSVRSLDPDRAWRRGFFLFLAFLLVLSAVARIWPRQVLDYLLLVLLTLFFFAALIRAARQVLFVGRVDANRIAGSLSLYLLLGLIWTMIYLVLLTIDPGAFHGLEFSNWRHSFPRVAYYSFVTLTTLGYGDILPVNHLAQFFAYMEAVTGIFYMAIVVASLVSIGLTNRAISTGKSDADPDDRV